ncbi:MAG: SBBP repeat-containing protein [Candidatus Hodarchaeota archaeon]
MLLIGVSGTGSIYFAITPSIICPPGSPIDWEQTWGGNDNEILYELVVDSLGYFYLAGETWSYGNGSSDLFLVKMNGTVAENNTWGGVESEEFSGMVLDSNDNIYVAGSTLSYGAGEKDVILLKYNTSVKLEWDELWGTNNSDICRSIAVDSFDNVYITGINNNPYYDIFLAKYDRLGIQQWNRTWSTERFNITEEVFSLVIDSTDNIFLSVKTNFTGSEWFLLNYNSSGNLLLNISYSKYHPLELLVLDSLNNLYAAGSYNDMYLSKLDNNGNVEWNVSCIQNVLKSSEVLAIDPFDNIVIAGNELINASANLYGYNITDYDTYLMKYNNTGVIEWNHTIPYSNNLFPEIIAFNSLGYIYLGGSSEFIATKELTLSVVVFDQSGNIRRSEGGGEIKYCEGIYGESVMNFTVAGYGYRYLYPTGTSTDYDLILIKYKEPEYYCPYDPLNHYIPVMIIFNILFYISCIIGVIFLIKQRKTRLKTINFWMFRY